MARPAASLRCELDGQRVESHGAWRPRSERKHVAGLAGQHDKHPAHVVRAERCALQRVAAPASCRINRRERDRCVRVRVTMRTVNKEPVNEE
jgi:hypothetical protein